jgi:hypothetical protein
MPTIVAPAHEDHMDSNRKVIMTAGSSLRDRSSTTTRATDSSRLVFGTLTGLAGLAVLLQGLWAGEFLKYHGAATRDARESWINVHARGGEVAIALAAVATIWALLRLRSRLDLLLGGAVLTVLLLAIAYVGGLITDSERDDLIPLHIPLALTSLVLATWLTWQALRVTRSTR